MNTLDYSILYAMIRPEISERVSVGIIFCQNGQIEVRYSTAKLNAVKSLLPQGDFNYLRRTVLSMATKNTIGSMASIDYLNRYSNNILAVSSIRQVKMDSPHISREKLYKMYVYDRQPSA